MAKAIDTPFNPKNQITNEKLNTLKAIGYTGDSTLEDLLLVITADRQATGKPLKIDGRGWWVDFKNEAEKNNKTFIDEVFLEVEKILKK